MSFLELWVESVCLTEAAEPIPDDYIKKGDKASFQQNIRYFRKKKEMPVKQAVAAAISVMKRYGGSYP